MAGTAAATGTTVDDGHRRRDLIPALAVFGIALAIYGTLASRDLGWVDSVEFALAALTFGIPHPTGYPLYTTLARLLAATGLDPVLAVSLLSAMSGAAASAVTLLAARRMGLGITGALAGALALAGSRELMAQSTVAEVYSLHLFLVALMLYLGLRSGGIRAGGTGGAASFLLLAYLIGLGLAHHLTVVLVLPALAVLLLGSGRSRGLGARGLGARRWITAPVAVPRTLWAALVLLLVGVSFYGVLAIRSGHDPVLDQGNPETLGRLVTHLSGRQFGYRFLTSGSTYAWSELGRFLGLLAEQWTPVHLPLAGVGLAALLLRPRSRPVVGALLVLVAAVVTHAIAYRIPDKEAYYLPAYLAVALFIAAGVDAVMHLLAGRSSIVRRLAGGALLALVLAPGLAHLPEADRSHDRSLRDLTREVMRRTTPGSLLVSDDTSLYFAALYLSTTASEFPDRELVAQYLLPLDWYADRLVTIDPGLPGAVAAREASRRGLGGRELGERLSADATALAARVTRRALAERPVFLYFHSFDEDRKSFEGLELVDCGLVYRVAGAEDAARGQVASRDTVPDTSFERLAAYTGGRRLTFEERATARRFAVSASRSGIKRVSRRDLRGAETEFKKALSLDPDYAQAWLNLGLLYADYLGEPGEAVRAWRKYLELAGNEPGASAVRARMPALEADAE